MTLLVAVKCRDGIVLGADGAATSGTSRAAVDKVVLADDHFAFACAGNPTIGGGAFSAGKAAWLQFAGKARDAAHFATLIQERVFVQALEPQLQIAHRAAAVNSVQKQGIYNNALCLSLFAGGYGDDPLLFIVGGHGELVLANDNAPALACGSGGQIADPFLLFLKRNLWPAHGLPDLGLGILSVVWTIDHAIQTNPGGVDDPVSLAIISREHGRLRARRLSDAELGEHRQAIGGAEGSLQDYLREVQMNGARVLLPTRRVAAPPPPPPPPMPPDQRAEAAPLTVEGGT